MVRRLDLDSEQQREVRTIIEQFRAAQRRFQVNHGRPLRELRRKAREARQEGKPLPVELRRQIREFQSKAPKPETYQQQVWDLLTAPQQERLRELLTVVRREMAERRAKESATGRDPSLKDRPPRRPNHKDGPLGSGAHTAPDHHVSA